MAVRLQLQAPVVLSPVSTEQVAIKLVVYIPLNQCFSNYFILRDPKTATEHTEKPLPVHSRSNIKLNTSIFYLLCTLHVKNQRLSSNCSTTWSFRLTQWLCPWRAVLTAQNREYFGLKQRLIVCVLSVTEWLVSNVATRTFNS